MIQISLLTIKVKEKYKELKSWMIKNIKYMKEEDFIFDEDNSTISLNNIEVEDYYVSSDFYSGFFIKNIFECVRGIDLELVAELLIDDSTIYCNGTIHNKRLSYTVNDTKNNSIIKIVL